jgi:major vault protein
LLQSLLCFALLWPPVNNQATLLHWLTLCRQPNQALRVRARKETKDRDGTVRVTGEEWLVQKVGAYLPGVYEEVTDIVNAYVLTEKKALHMRATRTFRDIFDKQRKTGE